MAQPKLCTNTYVFSYKLPKFPCASIQEGRYLQEAFNEYKKMISHGILLLLASSFATSNDLFRESVVQQEVVPGWRLQEILINYAEK